MAPVAQLGRQMDEQSTRNSPGWDLALEIN